MWVGGEGGGETFARQDVGASDGQDGCGHCSYIGAADGGDAGLALKINISIWLCLDFGSVRIHPGSSHLWYLFVESARKKDIIEVNTSPAVATRITNISPW